LKSGQERFGVIYSERAISDLLHTLSFSYISSRPQHPRQDQRVLEGFKIPRTLAAHIGHLPKDRRVEIWFQDEARLGQKNGCVRLWAKKGSRPRLPADQRYENAYLFGAICPLRGKGAALMLPSQHAGHADASRRDQPQHRRQGARRRPHGQGGLAQDRQTENLTIILLPSRSPELNPVENIWQYLRQNWLSNRVFEDYDAILEAGCEAWNRLIAQPQIIMSIGMRDWPHAGQ
jgi:hypothetical protein